MLEQVSRTWWAMAIRGIAAIVLGILAFVWPGITFEVLVLFFGAYAFVDGIFAVAAALTHRTGDHRWLLLLEGIVGILLGIVTFFRPGLTAFALVYVIAAWGVITGVLEILAAIRLRRELANELLLLISGVVSVIFGFAVALFPAAGAIAIAYMIGAYALIFGILLLIFAFRMRGMTRRPTTEAGRA